MTLETWLKIYTNVCNIVTAFPQLYKLKNSSFIYHLEGANLKITMFAHFQECHRNHEKN